MVFQCECCQYSTPFKYGLKQHLGTKKHLKKMNEASAAKEETEEVDETAEMTMEMMRSKIEEQKNTIEDLFSQIEILKTNQVNGSFNTTNNTVKNIHMLLHPDMHLTQLTSYHYKVILKKIQDQDYEVEEEGEEE